MPRRYLKILMNRWLLLGGLLMSLLLIWLSSSEDPRIWSVRNTLEYELLTRWWKVAGTPQIGGPGMMNGTVTNLRGAPIADAEILLSRWDGVTYHTRSDAAGNYEISGVPAGYYRPVAGASGYASYMVGGLWGGVQIDSGFETVVPIELAAERVRELPPPQMVAIGEPTNLHCPSPLESRATRRSISYQSAGSSNSPTFLYTPVDVAPDAQLATLLAVYPGPVETWECTSVPLAAAGYAVLAIGPAYSLELERDMDELEQLLALARAGALPQSDGERIAALGGSYSAILTQRLIQRDPTIDVSVLLGAPTNLFDSRHRWHQGTFVPPFEELEQALIALGFPDRDPLNYWRYSSLYHVYPDMPPTILFHSYQDDIVPYEQSEQLAAVLAEKGVEHELYLFDGATHYLLEGSDQAVEIYRLTIAFLEQYLEE